MAQLCSGRAFGPECLSIELSVTVVFGRKNKLKRLEYDCLQTSFSALFPQDPAPQHFHKPNYIDKSRPQITYSQVCIFSRKPGLLVNLIMFLTNCSQLNLGQGYRYNSKQSIPDINKDIDDANRRLGKPLFEMCCFHMGFARKGGGV